MHTVIVVWKYWSPCLKEHQPEQEAFCTFVSTRCFRTFFVSSVQMGWFIYTFRKKPYHGDIQLNIANTECNIRLILMLYIFTWCDPCFGSNKYLIYICNSILWTLIARHPNMVQLMYTRKLYRLRLSKSALMET